MNIKLDENLPERLVGVLAELGHDVDTVRGEGLGGQTDERVWEAVQEFRRFLITQDLDFSDLRRFTSGTHYGVLLVRLRRPGRDALVHCIRSAFETEDVVNWPGRLVVLTERKLRIFPARFP